MPGQPEGNPLIAALVPDRQSALRHVGAGKAASVQLLRSLLADAHSPAQRASYGRIIAIARNVRSIPGGKTSAGEEVVGMTIEAQAGPDVELQIGADAIDETAVEIVLRTGDAVPGPG